MKRNLRKKTPHGITFLMLYLIVCLIACKDDNLASTYDPSSPVEIIKIDPEEGGVGTQCLIYGKNFGTDISQIEVTRLNNLVPISAFCSAIGRSMS